MKSYKGLFNNILNLEEIKAAIVEASQGKRGRRNVAETLKNLDGAAVEIQKILLNGWKPRKHKRGSIREGGHKKKRDNIQKPAWWPEQIIHHLIVRQLKPIIVPRMADNVCGIASGEDLQKYKPHLFNGANKPSGRGALWAAKRMAKWRDEYNGKKFYVLETDVKSFYDSIDIYILLAKLSKIIKDARFLEICWAILNSAGPGIPKGFYTSPWFAQLYFMDTDNYIMQDLKPDHYMRYMDNMWLFMKNKRKLRKARDGLQGYISKNLSLSLNGTTQIYRFEHILKDRDGLPIIENGKTVTAGRAIECVGYIVHCDRITIRKNILKRIRAKAFRIDRKQSYTAHNCTAMLSYKGWFKYTNTRGYYKRHIKPHVTWWKLRKKLKRRNESGKHVENGAVCGKAG